MRLLLVGMELAVGDTYGFGPTRESPVRTCQTPTQLDDALPKKRCARRARDRERIKQEEIQMNLNEPSGRPIEWARTKNTQEVRLVFCITGGPQQIRRGV